MKRICQRSRDPADKNLFNAAQARFRRRMNNYTQDTYQSDIEQLNTTEGSIWRRTRNLKTKHFDIPQMKSPLNNHPAHTEKDKVEIIANHFETQFKLKNFGTARTEITDSKSIEKFFTHSPTPIYEKVKASEIADYLKKIKIKKALELTILQIKC
ncbi:hypothetical protein AVEN_191463-1 [Araneus ventricosus]|uniref:Uncharacterized protein n=1 Tax=Araneus ventricosus TaxID=182803 RepID=A0A4Y2UF52_ARAVE|nr:hypothetical protein AVEN_191463-1 [Araneus ventricosus]